VISTNSKLSLLIYFIVGRKKRGAFMGVLVGWGDLTINNKILEMYIVEIQRAVKQNDCLVAFLGVFGCIFINSNVKLEHNLKDRKNAKPL
jgi:hypothetical protein